MEDAGRGWRRTVPSPRPQRILESETIRLLLDNGRRGRRGRWRWNPRIACKRTAPSSASKPSSTKTSPAACSPTNCPRTSWSSPLASPAWPSASAPPSSGGSTRMTVAQARAYLRRPANSAPVAWSQRSPPSPTSSPARPARSASSGCRKRSRAIIEGRSGTRIVSAARQPGRLRQPASDSVSARRQRHPHARSQAQSPNMMAAGATFVREAATEPAYRLWSDQ